MQSAKVVGVGSKAARASGDHLAKRQSKAASKPAERSYLLAVPSLNFIILIIIFIKSYLL